MAHCTYLSVHEKTGLYYIGKSDENSISRGYLGSGVKMRLALKKYPREEWKCTVLWVFDTAEEAYSDEAGIITYEMIADPLCLNSCLGGGKNIGKIFTDEERLSCSKTQKIAQSTPEAKAAHSKATIKRYQNEEERLKTSLATKKSWIARRAKKELV